MQPVPPEVGKLNFRIVRRASLLNKLTPSYTLYFEKTREQKYQVLYGKKISFKGQSYYLINLEKNYIKGPSRKALNCIGKLRAMPNEKNKFVLYDTGENFSSKNVVYKDIRREFAYIMYRYDPSYDGNIRKM